jgi:rhamnulokinase
MTSLFAAIDLGASSGRVIAGLIDATSVSLHEIHRFTNIPVDKANGLYWNFDELKTQIAHGLKKLGEFAELEGKPVVSIAVDSWAVDYGLLDSNGNLIDGVRHYRDERNALGVASVEQLLTAEELYRQNGLQFLPFNTVYQLAAEHLQDPGNFAATERFLMVPDLINHWLTGISLTERTNASSTGLLDIETHEWNLPLIKKLGLKAEMFTALSTPGDIVGPLLPEFVTSDSFAETVVTAAPSHDTAAAVAGTPLVNQTTAYLSSGTWSLLGLELEHPNISAAARHANFTNELGVENRTRFLKNLSGLWLLQQSMLEFQKTSPDLELSDLLISASKVDSEARIDVTDVDFSSPGDMPAKIQTACSRNGHEVPKSPAAIVRCILDSLADAYAEAVDGLREVSGIEISGIQIVGGGSQNELLAQLTADATRLTVFTGPVEATAIGNLMTQASAHGVIAKGLEAQRDLIRRSFSQKTFNPCKVGA